MRVINNISFVIPIEEKKYLYILLMSYLSNTVLQFLNIYD